MARTGVCVKPPDRRMHRRQFDNLRLPAPDDTRYQPLIEKQNAQLAQLRGQLQSLRTQYNDFKRVSQSQILELQRQLYAVQRRREALSQRAQELRDSASNRAHAQMADEMIRQICGILSTYQKPPSPFAPRSQPSPTQFDADPEPPLRALLPLTPDTPRRYSEDPTLSTVETPVKFESIASRRARRPSAANVYYKEPSLRAALSPGDPFTFSVEGGLVTPTLPDGYTRETPTVARRGRTSARRK